MSRYKAAIEKLHLEEDWDEALQYNALWTLISGFLALSQSPENDRAYVKEYVDKAIRVLKN